jgi:hypothetical protein
MKTKIKTEAAIKKSIKTEKYSNHPVILQADSVL